MNSPLIVITLSYLCGLVLGHGILFFPLTGAVLALTGVAVALIFFRYAGKSPRSLGIPLTACLAGVLLYVLSAASFPNDHYRRILTFDRNQHEVTGRIISPLDRDPGRTAFVLDVRTIDGQVLSGKMRVTLREDETVVGYGDRVRISGRIYEPTGYANPRGFQYPEYLARQGIFALMSIKSAAEVTVLQRGSGLFRIIQDWRERIRRAMIAETTGPGSAVLQAMVVGEEGGLTDAIRDQFMAAGVTHILSISGSHLGLVALLCFGLLRALFFALPERHYHVITLSVDPRKVAAWITLVPVTFYALLAGGQVATMRSLVMIVAALAALVLDRSHSLMHALAAAALGLLLLWPQALFDISFQLSYLSVLTIGYVVTLWNDLRLPAESRFRKALNGAALLVVISIAAGLATGPLVAFHFNQISLIGVVSNMVIVPFAGLVVVPLGLLSGMYSLITGALPLATVNQFLADLFVKAVFLFSRFPLAELRPPAPGVIWLLAYALMFASAAGYLRARLLFHRQPLEFTSRPSLLIRTGMAAGLTTLALLTMLSFSMPRETRLTLLDVGQGDCSLLELTSGETILIDGGGAYDNRFDIGRRIVAPYLWNRGISALDLIVLSHPHPDHLNGLLFILDRFRVRNVWVSGGHDENTSFGEFKTRLERRGVPLQVQSAGWIHAMGNAKLHVLHPDQAYQPSPGKAYSRENNGSLVVRADAPGMRVLFTGDCETDAEAALMRSGRDLRCDVVKIPHHGSRSSSTAAFIAASRPAFAIASAGKGNRFGHPSDEVVARYVAAGARVYQTGRDGAIIATASKRGIEVHAWSELALMRISLEDSGRWLAVERDNWRRIATRLALWPI